MGLLFYCLVREKKQYLTNPGEKRKELPILLVAPHSYTLILFAARMLAGISVQEKSRE